MLDRPICYGCKHRARKGGGCAAFPKGIPVEILWSEVDHREAYEGDGGIRFVPVTPVDAERAAEIFRNGAGPLQEDVNA